MNKLDKIMRDKRKYPKILCDDKELISDIGSWLGIKSNIKKEFGKTLLSLGFKTTDEIVLCKYNKKAFSFTYIVNGCNPYKKNTIWLNGGFIDGEPTLILKTGTRKTRDMKVYKCSRDKNNKIDNNFVIVFRDKNLSNGISCCRSFNQDYLEFEVEYPNGYSLSMKVDKPYYGLLSEYENYFDKNDKLRNEELLVDYLVDLKFPIGIEEIYKNICDICFTDVSIFPKFILSIENFNNDNILDLVVDKITLEYGILKEFITTRNGRYVVIDKDGNWRYEINKNGNILDYKDNEDDNLVSGFIWGSNKDETEDVKKLVRNMFNNGRKL